MHFQELQRHVDSRPCLDLGEPEKIVDDLLFRKWQGSPVGDAEAWIEWLSPVFKDNQSMYFTGTYSDEYGFAHGLMKQRNVFKDFERYLDLFGFQKRYVVAVERHRYRDILHLHAVLEGPFSSEMLAFCKACWAATRGHARALEVKDGCLSYVTKYALKGDVEAFEWRMDLAEPVVSVGPGGVIIVEPAVRKSERGIVL